MGANDQDTKENIQNVVKAMIEEGMDPDSVTVRQIADRAGIGVGLINYYFKSKNNLVSQVVGDIMAVMVSDFFKQSIISDQEPVIKLKTLLKEMYAFGEKYEKHVKYLITHSLLEGDLGAALLLIPRLKEVFKNKEEFELRIIALQILLPIQVASLNPSAFRLFGGIDLRDAEQRNKFIDVLINNVLKDIQR